MKKLVISLLSLICVFALSVPVFADLVWIPRESAATEPAAAETVAAGPSAAAETVAAGSSAAAQASLPTAVLIVGCGIVAAALILFLVLRKKKR